MLPVHFPPWQTVYWWFRRFVRLLLFRTIHDLAVMIDRARVGREASPSAGVVDSQSVKAPMAAKRGYDGGKKVTGRKRHVLVDTLGLLLNVVVHPADVQDRDGARLVLDRRTRRLFPFVERVFADAGYQEPKAAAAVAKTGAWTLEIVKRRDLHRFVVLPKRWIVERETLALPFEI